MFSLYCTNSSLESNIYILRMLSIGTSVKKIIKNQNVELLLKPYWKTELAFSCSVFEGWKPTYVFLSLCIRLWNSYSELSLVVKISEISFWGLYIWLFMNKRTDSTENHFLLRVQFWIKLSSTDFNLLTSLLHPFILFYSFSDIKPANILVSCSDCSVKIADFGLSRVVEANGPRAGILPPILKTPSPPSGESRIRRKNFHLFFLWTINYCRL